MHALSKMQGPRPPHGEHREAGDQPPPGTHRGPTDPGPGDVMGHDARHGELIAEEIWHSDMIEAIGDVAAGKPHIVIPIALQSTESSSGGKAGSRRVKEEPIHIPGVQDDPELSALFDNKEDTKQAWPSNAPAEHASLGQPMQEGRVGPWPAAQGRLAVRLGSVWM